MVDIISTTKTCLQKHVLTDQLSVQLEIAQIKDKVQHQDKKQDSQNKNIEIIFRYLDELQNKLVEINKPRKRLVLNPNGNKAKF